VLEAALCEGWQTQNNFDRRYRAGSPLFDHVIARKATIHVALPAGEAILAHQGVLAGPILSPESRTVRGMLKIERLSFEDFTPAAAHNFKVLCDWLGAALGRAEDLQRARATSLMAEDGSLLSRRLLSRIEDLLARLAKREQFALSAIDIDIESASDSAREALPGLLSGLLSAAAAEALRGTDLAFESRDGRGCCMLLPGATEKEAREAATRLQLALERQLSQAKLDVDVRARVRLINSGKTEELAVDDKKVT